MEEETQFEGATPAGVIEMPDGMTAEEAEAFVAAWRANQEAEAVRVALAEKLAGGGEPTAEEAALLAAAPQQVQIPAMTIPLQNCQIRIVPNDEGGRNLFVGPLAITFVLPFSQEGTAGIVRDLTGGIEIAKTIPKLEVAR